MYPEWRESEPDLQTSVYRSLPSREAPSDDEAQADDVGQVTVEQPPSAALLAASAPDSEPLEDLAAAAEVEPPEHDDLGVTALRAAPHIDDASTRTPTRIDEEVGFEDLAPTFVPAPNEPASEDCRVDRAPARIVERAPLIRIAASTAKDDREALASLLVALEHELRAAGHLSFATCEALCADPRLRGLETCLGFMRCTLLAEDVAVAPFARNHRIQVCRLLLLSIGAHTDVPRWSQLQLVQLVEAAFSIPGAELSDQVLALFVLLGEVRDPVNERAARFIREYAWQIAGKHRLGHAMEDLVWIAVRLVDPSCAFTQAQALLAAAILPRAMLRAPRRAILRAFEGSPLLPEVHLLLLGGSS